MAWAREFDKEGMAIDAKKFMPGSKTSDVQ